MKFALKRIVDPVIFGSGIDVGAVKGPTYGAPLIDTSRLIEVPAGVLAVQVILLKATLPRFGETCEVNCPLDG